MAMFSKKSSISRPDLRSALRKDSGIIKGGEGRYSSSEREKLVKDVFGSKYGSEISRLDFKRAIRSLEAEKSRKTSIKEKEVIDDKIKYLKQVGGQGV